MLIAFAGTNTMIQNNYIIQFSTPWRKLSYSCRARSLREAHKARDKHWRDKCRFDPADLSRVLPWLLMERFNGDVLQRGKGVKKA